MRITKQIHASLTKCGVKFQEHKRPSFHSERPLFCQSIEPKIETSKERKYLQDSSDAQSAEERKAEVRAELWKR